MAIERELFAAVAVGCVRAIVMMENLPRGVKSLRPRSEATVVETKSGRILLILSPRTQ